MKTPNFYITFLAIMTAVFASCEKNFDIAVTSNQPQLIVEAYVNNELPLYNYVIIGRSQDYYTPDFVNVPASGATVTITEGELLSDNSYNWDIGSKKQLKEIRLPQLDYAYLPGVYFDTALLSNPSGALIGRPGKHYLLEIESEGNHYTAITAMLQHIPVDSLTNGQHFSEEDEGSIKTKARITVHFKDPDTIGNTQLYYWRSRKTGDNFGWGALGTNRYTPGTDDLVNGQYIHLTHSSGFETGDTVQYYMACVERKVYNFWDSFTKARENLGPFSTPVQLQNTISGENVIGCFSGFSVSTRTIVIK